MIGEDRSQLRKIRFEQKRSRSDTSMKIMDYICLVVR